MIGGGGEGAGWWGVEVGWGGGIEFAKSGRTMDRKEGRKTRLSL